MQTDYTLFHDDLAKEIGLESAIILEKISGWVKHNTLQGHNIIDGKAWVYNSVRAWQESMPYLSSDLIKRRLAKLREEGWLETRQVNASKYDHTNWYTLSEKSIGWFSANRLAENPPINKDDIHQSLQLSTPSSNFNITPPTPQGEFALVMEKQEEKQETCDELAERIWKTYPRKDNKEKGLVAIKKAIKRCKTNPVALFDMTLLYRTSVKKWSEVDQGFVPYASTWFNGKRYNDDPRAWKAKEVQSEEIKPF